MSFTPDAAFVIRFLNAGRSAGEFYEDQLPVHLAKVDRLPQGVSALIATADLQGRERFEEAPHGPPRLLGEVLPRRLVEQILPELSVDVSGRVGVLLAGDFYTVLALDRRGGDGDVTSVWQAFGQEFDWVVGVPGNHDTFGSDPRCRPRFPDRLRFLDGNTTTIDGIKFAGLGGIIGNTRRPHRRGHHDYLATLKNLVDQNPEILVMHEGPAGATTGQPGMSEINSILDESQVRLVIRGDAHWSEPLAEFPNGLQVLNVDCRVVVLTENDPG